MLFDNPKRTDDIEPPKANRWFENIWPSLSPCLHRRPGRRPRQGLRIATYYEENEPARRSSPELFRMLANFEPSDVLLIEQDRLSSLNAADWERLKSEIVSGKVRVVALYLPRS